MNVVVSLFTCVCRGMIVTVQPGDGSFHPGSPATYSGLTVSKVAVLEGHQAEQGMLDVAGDTLSMMVVDGVVFYRCNFSGASGLVLLCLCAVS